MPATSIVPPPTCRKPNFTSYSRCSPAAKGTAIRVAAGGVGTLPAWDTFCAERSVGTKAAASNPSQSARGIWRPPRGRDATAVGTGEPEQVDSIGPGMNAALTRAEIVPRLQLDRLDTPCEGRGA